MDKITLKKLKMLVESNDWDVVSLFMEQIIKKWHNVPVKGESEFETLWNCAHTEGKIEGVKEFINSIEQLSNES